MKLVKIVSVVFGLFLLVSAFVFGIAVYRAARTTAPVVISSEPSKAKNFTQAGVVPSLSVPANTSAVTDNDPSIGSAQAAVTVVEFSDFECPFCRQAFPIVRELMAKYSDRVRFIYRDFPVSQIHANAAKAAEAGECAHAQGKFWALHDKIFQNVPAITVADLKRYAREVGLDGARFDACLDSGQFASEVAQDYADGVALGVRGTPTWFINGKKVEGVIPRESFIQIFDRLLVE